MMAIMLRWLLVPPLLLLLLMVMMKLLPLLSRASPPPTSFAHKLVKQCLGEVTRRMIIRIAK